MIKILLLLIDFPGAVGEKRKKVEREKRDIIVGSLMFPTLQSLSSDRVG